MNVKLPKNERRKVSDVQKHKLWIYGAPFSGKTTLADKFPNPFMLNTDGNYKYVTAPATLIADKVDVDGRIVETTLAWEIFKAYVDELAKKENDYQTIVVDLIEDMYEHCRQYIYREMGITHESEDSFRAWDRVRTEFLTVIKKLLTLDYDNIILISQEDVSRDIMKRTGDKVTAIKPNINDKVALKLAGMVDIVIRAVSQDDIYKLTFKSDEVVFGGGRIKLNVKEIDNDYKALMKVISPENKSVEPKTEPVAESKPVEPKTETIPTKDEEPTEPTPRRRRRRNVEEEEIEIEF